MSDTPRTDELAKRDFITDGVWIRHARELERENAALRADKERLDWLETQDCWIGVYGEYDINARISAGGSYSQRIRSAVDAARKEAQP